MKILYLAPNIPVPGTHGGSVHVASVHRALSRQHEVLLLARRGSTEPGALAFGFGNSPPMQYLLPAYYISRILAATRRFRPDVIYERYSAFGLGVALGRILGRPSVLMTLDRDASPLSFRYSSRIVATSDSFVAPRYRHKLRLVHWGVDPERFTGADGGAIRRALAPNGERLVVYTGSCHHWHGLDLLAEVAARWTGPPLVFVLIGEGPALAALRRRIAALNLGRFFALVGRIDHREIGPYVAAADVCIAPYAPSRHPIFRRHGMDRDPIKVLEYMAAGKPTMTIDAPRLRALFRADEEVILYPPEDVAACSAALAALLSDPERAARVAAAGARLVRTRYTWEQHAKELTAVFEEAVGARAAGARSR